MSLTPIPTDSLRIQNVNSYEEAKSAQSNLIWQQLEKITINEAAELAIHLECKNTYQLSIRPQKTR